MKKKVSTCKTRPTNEGIEVKDANSQMLRKEFGITIDSKAEPQDGFFRFKGLGSTFGNIDLVDDVMVKGCFRDSLEKEQPVILWQHDRYEPIGIPEAIKETDQGLELDVIMPADDDFVKGRVMPQLRIGSVKAMSIGFRVEEFIIKDGIRYITKALLKEVSLVTFPANEKAVITQVKSFGIKDVETMTKRDLEKTLRESGLFSKEAAVYIASKFPETGEPDNGFDEEAATKACEKILGLQKTDGGNYNEALLLEKLESIANKPEK